MWQICFRHWLALTLVGLTGGTAALSVNFQKPDKQTPIKIQVETSVLKEARAYYTETFNALGIKPDLNNNQPGLAVLLRFLGYQNLTPKSLEDDPLPLK